MLGTRSPTRSSAHEPSGLHDPAHADRGRPAWSRRRRGTTSATSWWSTSTPIPTSRASLLPEGLEPHPDAGRCAAVFADWQSCSDGGDELLDPSRSHYREFYIVVNALLDGEEVTTCPFIWVDQDFAMARGWIQGFPKKLGEVWMTRTFALGSAGPRPGIAAGSRFGGDVLGARPRDRARDASRCEARERERLAAHRTRRSSTCATSRAWPPAATTSPQVHELVRSRQPRPLGVGGLGGRRPSWSCSTRRARSTRCSRRSTVEPRLPLHVRLHRRRPRDRQGAAIVSLTAPTRVAGVDVSPDHFIGGERVGERPSASRPSRRSTSRCWPRSRAATRGEVDRAVRAAHDAFPAWAALGPAGARRSTCTGSPT